MFTDPVNLQNASGDCAFARISLLGGKSVFTQTSGTDASQLEATMTISHEDNSRTGRRRSVLRFDSIHNPTEGEDDVKESAAVYLVIDRPVKTTMDPTAAIPRRLIAQLLSFFIEDPTAAASGNLDYNIDSSNANRLINGEP
jgi:hypothetical protein